MFKFIAEVGINHNGDLGNALELISRAKQCGCDIVKFQKRTPEICVPISHQNRMKYGTPWGNISYLEYRKKIELEYHDYRIINDHCKALNIDWMASVWDLESAELINDFDLKYNKIPSAMITNIPLLEKVAIYGKYTFISTGACTIDDIDKAIGVFQSRNCPFELMHTISTYPMRNEDANLRMISVLKNKYNCNVGWSGHEVGIQISIAAVVLGATSVERHVTLDRSMWGSDHAASLGFDGLRRLVRDCHIVRNAMGDGVKRVLPEEEEKMKSLRG